MRRARGPDSDAVATLARQAGSGSGQERPRSDRSVIPACADLYGVSGDRHVGNPSSRRHRAAPQCSRQGSGRSKESCLQEAIVEYLGDLEDFYLAEQRLDDIKAGRAGTVTLAEVECDLGLAN